MVDAVSYCNKPWKLTGSIKQRVIVVISGCYHDIMIEMYDYSAAIGQQEKTDFRHGLVDKAFGVRCLQNPERMRN